MRWLVALGVGTCAVTLACGASFTLAPDDAMTGDAPDDGLPEGALSDASKEVADAIAVNSADADVAGDDTGGGSDAAPPHCGAPLTCAPAVPSGWTGPLELYAGSDASPACGASFSGTTLDGNASLTWQAASCDCQCDLPQGVQCSSPAMAFYASSATCSAGTWCTTVTLAPNTCTAVDVRSRCLLSPSGPLVSIPASTPSQGSCAPVPFASVPAYTWATHARACGIAVAPAQSDCPTGDMCVPAPASPFRTSVCIERAGDVPCPSMSAANHSYGTRYVYYGDVNDTRGCSACTCGPVSGASCSGSLTQFNSTNTSCNTAQAVYKFPQTCAPIRQPEDFEVALLASNGTCTPSAVSYVGSATPAKPMTFCCLP